MKAISLWQPWASLWLSPRKIHETRHWATRHRGWLLVHAAQRIEYACGEDLDEICLDEFGGHWRRELPRGALLGAIDLVACHVVGQGLIETLEQDDRLCGNFALGRSAWQRGRAVALAEPLLYRGQQGLFEVPDRALPRSFLQALAA